MGEREVYSARPCMASEWAQRVERQLQSQRHSRKAEASSIASRKAWRTREQSDQSVNCRVRVLVERMVNTRIL